MAKTITLGEAITRFEDLVTTDIEVQDAITEAIDRIYEMGRWPGTTVEIELTEDLFVEQDNGWYVLELDDLLYNGAVGFRNDYGGWSIRDHEVLYKDGVNAGDRDFVDFGSQDRVTLGVPSKVRRYRCPLSFNPASGGPYYALMKLEPPSLALSDPIPIESIGALKAAIRGVCYEYVNDDTNADLQWQKFEIAVTRSARQVDGPKKRYIGTDSSLRRKPKQFM